MICKRCGNKDPVYFYKGHKGYYCRKCISFKRVLLEEEIEPFNYEVSSEVSEYRFNFPLTSFQERAANECLTYIKDADVLLNVCCGGGKTEIVVKTISDFLRRGLKVCYAIARKEVVIELAVRFKQIFNNARVVSVYGGHHDILVGDLIVCTTHQLYRYYQSFDLLVLDEVDAFPLKGNETLMNISLNSCRGRIIYSTATVDDGLKRILALRDYKEVRLFVRPSLKPLIVPRVFYFNKFIHYFILGYLLVGMENQCIIFVSSKEECHRLYNIYRHFLSCTYVYSDLDNRRKNINDFKNRKYKFIFSTTVLERGITIKDVNVIILNWHKNVFDKSSLVQMLGRVGRSFTNPYGRAYILSCFFSKDIMNTISYLKEANSYL